MTTLAARRSGESARSNGSRPHSDGPFAVLANVRYGSLADSLRSTIPGLVSPRKRTSSQILLIASQS